MNPPEALELPAARRGQQGPSATVDTGTATGGGAQPATGPQWSPSLGMVSITVTSSKSVPKGAMGVASVRGVGLFSTEAHIASFCVTPASYPLQFWFHVDAEGIPRPSPFTTPAVSVTLAFTPENGRTPTATQAVADPRPAYAGPGAPLVTNFGETLWTGSSGGGILGVAAAMADPDTGTTVRYDDQIGCRLEPCA